MLQYYLAIFRLLSLLVVILICHGLCHKLVMNFFRKIVKKEGNLQFKGFTVDQYVYRDYTIQIVITHILTVMLVTVPLLMLIDKLYELC